MSSVPVFERFAVDHYALYPGTSKHPGLDVRMQSGLTLVLGANGLGKTTLVTMLYRMCSGPWELRGSPGADLGGRNLEHVQLTPGARRIFASRVADGADGASATLWMRIGAARFAVTRQLRDLALTSLEIDDTEVDADEETYQSAVLAAAELPTYGDWLLFLRYLVFYFEDRRALVWDPSAQRQLIRLLFFPAARATEWAERERTIQTLDSKMRNLQAVVTRQEIDLTRQDTASVKAPAIRQELEALGRLQEIDEPRLQSANDRLLRMDAERQRARLDALTAERDHEASFRNLERLQLRVIDAAFPSGNETAKYLLAQLYADGHCLACGQEAAQMIENLRSRVKQGRCVICGSEVKSEVATPIGARVLKKAQLELESAAERLRATTRVRSEAETAYSAEQSLVQALNTTVAERRARMDDLIRRLPATEASIHERRRELAGLRGQVETMRANLSALRTKFTSFIEAVTAEMASRAEAVKTAFDGYAQGFMLDATELLWAPHADTVGQSGSQIDFPAFELTMGSASFPSPVRRSEPDQVSESQREFIDLAFRMTLMTVGTTAHAGTLIIDAPESSLDAVFVRRAADVLIRFADGGPDNRLLVTSNLIDGDLIPNLLSKSGIRTARDRRVVDLLSLAAPTAATTQWHDDYARVRRSIFQRAGRP